VETGAYDLIIAGGGPAATSAAIVAARGGARVLVLERGSFPRHKVCGEFVSYESQQLLSSLLGKSALLDQAARVGRARLFLGKTALESRLNPPVASISRYDLDMELWRAAEQSNADCRQQTTVSSIERKRDCEFHVATTQGQFDSRAVIDATGRWSNLRDLKSVPADAAIGLKAHFFTREPGDSVDLYFFDGGYCGIQPVGEGMVNACAMIGAHVAQGRSMEAVFAQRTDLWERSRGWTAATGVTATAPVAFRRPEPVRDGMLCVGDAAAFVDPFVGDGISMALHSGALAAELLVRHNF